MKEPIIPRLQTLSKREKAIVCRIRHLAARNRLKKDLKIG